MKIDRDTHDMLAGIIDDAVEHACREAFKEGTPISGELAWTVVSCRAEAKLAELEGRLTSM
jgi:hypothetical protein